MFAESSRSSTTGGTGTTNTRIAPTIVTGRTTPDRRDQPAATRLGVCGRHPFPSTTRTSTALPRHATTHDRPETDRSLRPQGRRASLLDQTKRRTSSPESVRLDSTRFRSTLDDELQTCGGTILPNPAGVQTESVAVPGPWPWWRMPPQNRTLQQLPLRSFWREAATDPRRIGHFGNFRFGRSGAGASDPRRIGLFGNFRFGRLARGFLRTRRIGLFGNFRFVRSARARTPRRIGLFGNFRFGRSWHEGFLPPAESDSSATSASVVVARGFLPPQNRILRQLPLCSFYGVGCGAKTAGLACRSAEHSSTGRTVTPLPRCTSSCKDSITDSSSLSQGRTGSGALLRRCAAVPAHPRRLLLPNCQRTRNH